MNEDQRAILLEAKRLMHERRTERRGENVLSISDTDLSIWQGLSEAIVIIENMLDPERRSREFKKAMKEITQGHRG